MLKRPELFTQGYHLSYYPLQAVVKEYVDSQNWIELDNHFKELTKQDGHLFDYLSQYHDFNSIEFIISIRDSQDSWEEDGIWHDDGSRVFAFSLSLTQEQVVGGRLGLRRIGEINSTEIPTPSFGGIIMFLTGIYGFEHKIHQVIRGKRIIIAGWCS